MSEKFLIIDGHSMAFRAFYALPAESFTTSSGQYTNAVYGFLSMLAKQLEDEKPTHLAVAFDASKESFRNDLYPDYKGTRAASPPEFAGQVELIEAVLKAMGVPQVGIEGYEADDILATLAKDGSEEGYEVLVASGDRDTFQLIDDNVTVLYPGRSTSDLTYMTPEEVEKRYGVGPSRHPELAAIVGETSDNLPGVPGVGPKTAAQWLNKYDGLEKLIESADKIGGKRGQAFRDSLEDVRMNRKLNHLLTDMELPLTPDECVVETPDRSELEDLFNTLQFNTLRDRVYRSMAPLWGDEVDDQTVGKPSITEEENFSGPLSEVAADNTTTVTPDFDLSAALDAMRGKDVALWGEGNLKPVEPHLDLLALTTQEQTVVVETAELTETQENVLANFLQTYDRFVVHEGKALTHGIQSRGWELFQPKFDVALAAYLCQPEQRRYGLDTLAQQYLELTHDPADDGAMFSVESLEDPKESGSPTPAQAKSGENSRIVLAVFPRVKARLKDQGGLELLHDIEIPVSSILEDMEVYGVAMDVEKLESLRDEYAAEARAAEQSAYDAIGHETNLGSPKQLQVVLFEELDMPKTRRTKTGYTTDAEALNDLLEKTGHPFLEALMLHRDRTKLVQMIETLLGWVQPDGRIHTTFSQIGTATGRISSSDPNLQNIPFRTELGRRIREAFVAGEGYEDLMSVDYSQIEMRIMAHLSNDVGLIEAFNTGEDLHRTMASQVFEVPLEEVDSDLRNQIKATSYGLAYGLSPYGLSRQLGVSVDEAKTLHKQYFERFGGVGRYLRDVVEQARNRGYTESMFHRRRYFPNLGSSSRRLREMSERAALNAPIQGTAADIIKVAMIGVAKGLEENDLKSRMLLQIHDELLLELAPGEAEEVSRIVEEAMAASASLKVPLEVSVGIGGSWSAAAH